MKVYPFKAVYPDYKLITSPDSFFKTVKNQFNKYRETGFFKKARKEAIYIHQIHKSGKTFTGIVATVDITEFEDNKVLKHENTIAAKQQVMTQLMLERKAMIKPILIAYDNHQAINEFLTYYVETHKPHLIGKFNEEEEKHSLYQINEKKAMLKLISLIDKYIDTSYIADGHHRIATIKQLYANKKLRTKANQKKSVLCVMFPVRDLEIHDFNRVINIFDSMSSSQFMARLSKYCKIQPLITERKPRKKYELTMYLNREWYLIEWRKKVLKDYKNVEVLLDAEILNDKILMDILEIEDVRDSHKIKYIEGVKGMEHFINHINEDDNRVGFCLFPVDIDEIKLIAQNNLNLPPKSTWFEPRIKNGLIAEDF